MIAAVDETLWIPDGVRAAAGQFGAHEWLAGLPDLIRSLERDWDITVGYAFGEGTAFVANLRGPEWSVLKLSIPRPGGHVAHERIALELADGSGLPQLRRADDSRNALLLERLGPRADPHDPRLLAMQTWALSQVWRKVPADCGLPSGADHARALLAKAINAGKPDEVEKAAENRINAHHDDTAVLVHGDPTRWHIVRVEEDPRMGYQLIDPKGLRAEPELDLGVLLRDADPGTDLRERARYLAAKTGTDETAIWEWGILERASAGMQRD
jgi:streptomycin 6-kinase